VLIVVYKSSSLGRILVVRNIPGFLDGRKYVGLLVYEDSKHPSCEVGGVLDLSFKAAFAEGDDICPAFALYRRFRGAWF
jgi:hypothetical protein